MPPRKSSWGRALGSFFSDFAPSGLPPDAEASFQRREFRDLFWAHVTLLLVSLLAGILVIACASPPLRAAAWYWLPLVASPLLLRIALRNDKETFARLAVIAGHLQFISLWPLAYSSGLHQESSSVYSAVLLICSSGTGVILPMVPRHPNPWFGSCIFSIFFHPTTMFILSGLTPQRTASMVAPILLGIAASILGFAGFQSLRRKHFAERERLASEKDRLLHDWRLAQDELSKIRSGSPNPPGTGSIRSNGTCSELEALMPLDNLPQFTCLPEFRNERTRSGSIVRYFTAADRERHLLRVLDGLLVDHKDAPLNAAGSSAHQTIFVMTPEGDMILSDNTQQHCHSSLVSGGPVVAAGTLLILRGRLLGIDNSSGHYRPPAASLGAPLARLASLGVALEHVDVSACTPDRARRSDEPAPRGIISAANLLQQHAVNSLPQPVDSNGNLPTRRWRRPASAQQRPTSSPSRRRGDSR